MLNLLQTQPIFLISKGNIIYRKQVTAKVKE
jgi:hypothetical protein